MRCSAVFWEAWSSADNSRGFFDTATSLLTVVGVILVLLIDGLRTHGLHSIAALSSQTVEVFATIDVL
jgi:hypothetical protein